jgi:hypothetical protein
MAQTQEGAIKIAAGKIGITVNEYKKLISKGLKWCFACRTWKKHKEFHKNPARKDGLGGQCGKCQNQYSRNHYIPVPENQKKHGPLPAPEREGDASQARHRINVLIRTGKIKKASELPCQKCGNIYKKGESRHEYHHAEGYSIGKHLIIIPLCMKCHRTFDGRRVKNGKD